MSDGPTIRRIGVDDYEAVAALLVLLGRPAPAPEARDAARAVYARHLDDPGTESLLALRDGVIPPTAHVVEAAADYAIDLVTGAPREADLRSALVLARGHGGFNAALVVRRTA